VNLCVEESVHVLFDRTNSLVEIDAQDDDFELGLAKKNLLLTHEECKYLEDRSGPGAVFLEGGQGLNQTGGSTAKPSLDQNQPILLEQVEYFSKSRKHVCGPIYSTIMEAPKFAPS